MKRRSPLANTSNWPHANLAASYALLGKMDEAKRYVAETFASTPKFTIKWLREHGEDIPPLTESLRNAGGHRSGWHSLTRFSMSPRAQ
jgi:hypothetical protein